MSKYLNISFKTIQNWTSSGKIPHKKLGSSVRYPKKEIDQALARGEIGRKVKNMK
jgi:excisionase family DNA binding protein